MPIRSRDIVAVVEDDFAASSSLAALIDSLDMDCRTFASAEEFLERGLDAAPSCIVIDLCLPGMNGLDLMERFVTRSDAPPIIFVTGFATIPLVVKMMRDGAYTVLEKTCRTQELQEAIRTAVSRHHHSQRERQEIREIKERFDSLTEIEWLVVQGIARGTPNAQLAEQLNLGLRTIEKRRQQIFHKLRVDTLPAFIQLLYRADPDLVRSFSADGDHNEEVPKSA